MKLGFKAMLIYENINNETFKGNSTADMLIAFYSSLVANNEITDTFDEVCEWLDDNPEALTEFVGIVAKQTKVNADVSPVVKGKAPEEDPKNV